MQSKRRWLPGWQRVELVCLCLDRGMSRREAASYRHVSVSTVQYWIDRYCTATEAEREDGSWAEDRPSTPHRQPGRVSEAVHDRVCEARERTGWGPRLIASELGMAHATVRLTIGYFPLPAVKHVTPQIASFTTTSHSVPVCAPRVSWHDRSGFRGFRRKTIFESVQTG